MEFSVKNILITICALFFAFTLYWFVQFGTIFWFLNLVGEEVSKSSAEYTQQAKINNERIKAEQVLVQLKKEQEQKKRMFIASGDHSKKISTKEKRCNDAILRAMADKSDEAKASKKALCEGV